MGIDELGLTSGEVREPESPGCTRSFLRGANMARFANQLFLVMLMLAASLCLGQSTNTAQPTQAPAQTSSSASPSQTTPPASTAKGRGVMPVDRKSTRLNSSHLG